MIKLRGHHLIRLEKFLQNELYYNSLKGNAFFGNEQELFTKIADSETEVIMIDSMDDVCEPCLTKENNCYSYGTMLYDHSVAERYGFEIGKVYSSEEAVRILKQQ